jgi:hypothetical protein
MNATSEGSAGSGNHQTSWTGETRDLNGRKAKGPPSSDEVKDIITPWFYSATDIATGSATFSFK